jgi:hypothetical protein
MGMTCSKPGEMRNAYKIFVNLKERDHLKDLGMDGRITLKVIQKK